MLLSQFSRALLACLLVLPLVIAVGAGPARAADTLGLGIERLTMGLIGRNLWTITDYTGFDPEVGDIRDAYDGFDYPNFRTFTVKMDVQF